MITTKTMQYDCHAPEYCFCYYCYPERAIAARKEALQERVYITKATERALLSAILRTWSPDDAHILNNLLDRCVVYLDHGER